MSNFRLVVLDYPKLHIENSVTKTILMDIIVGKQKNFERSDSLYVPNDKHDLIGTHFLIYDTSNPFLQKLIFGIRLTYEDRSEMHKVKLPILELLPFFEQKVLEEFKKFKSQNDCLVDCNSLFVDPKYSFKETGLKLAHIGYAMIYFYLYRCGKKNMLGGTNEKFKSSRWLEEIGNFKKDLMFVHPAVMTEHMLIMIESFKVKNIKEIFIQNQNLFENIIEFYPPSSNLQLLPEVYTRALAVNEQLLKQVG